MKTTKKRISIICLMLCFVMLLASCNSVDSNMDTSKTPNDTSSKEMIEESRAEESKIDEELSEAELYYVTEMTEEMANAFLKFIGEKSTISDLLSSLKIDYNYKNDYVAFGNLAGYTFCYVSPYFGFRDANAEETQYTVGDYEFSCYASNYNSNVSLYLYKDMTFMTFENAYEQGLIDPADAYKLMQNDFSGKNTICTSVKKLSK